MEGAWSQQHLRQSFSTIQHHITPTRSHPACVVRSNPSAPKSLTTALHSIQIRRLMTAPPIVDQPRRQFQRQMFRGVFQRWAKLRLQPDASSVAAGPIHPSGSGGNAP
jgi:hypothetical protein